MKKYQVFLYFCLMFIIGVALRSFVAINNFFLFIILISALVLTVIVWKHFSFRILFLGAFFLFLGILRYNLSIPNINENHIASYNNPLRERGGQEVVLSGVIAKEVDRRIDHQQITLKNLQINNRDIAGRLLITAGLYPIYSYGDQIQAECKLRAPENFNGFDYNGYLARFDIYSLCYYPDITIISRHNGNKLFGYILQFKQALSRSLGRNVYGRPGLLLEAITLGYRRNIPSDLQDQFSRAGVSHIIAISGMHIMILGIILAAMLVYLGVKRQYAAYFIIILLFSYIVLIGLPASATRAFLILVFWLLAELVGRLKKTLNFIVLAAMILLIVNPFLLRYDIGFQLSFLAVLGIFYFYPLLAQQRKALIVKKMRPAFGRIQDIIFLTIAAQITTLPLILYYFGNLSIISVVSNILIIPMVGITMILGFAAAILGFVPLLGNIAGLIAFLAAAYILKVIDILSSFKFASFHIDIHILGVLACYFIIVLFIYNMETMFFRKR